MSSQPSTYKDSAPSGEEAHSDEDGEELGPSMWTCVQLLLIVAVLAMAIAVLVLAIRGRGLAHRAFAMAQQSEATAQQASDTVNSQFGQFGADLAELKAKVNGIGTQLGQVGATLSKLKDKVGGIETNVADLGSHVSDLGSNFTSLQQGLETVTRKVGILENDVQALTKLETRLETTTAPSRSTSSGVFPSTSSYLAGGERVLCAAPALVLVETIVVMFL